MVQRIAVLKKPVDSLKEKHSKVVKCETNQLETLFLEAFRRRAKI